MQLYHVRYVDNSDDGVNLNRVLHSFNEEQQKSKYL